MVSLIIDVLEMRGGAILRVLANQSDHSISGHFSGFLVSSSSVVTVIIVSQSPKEDCITVSSGEESFEDVDNSF